MTAAPRGIVEQLRELTAPAARKCDTPRCDHPPAPAIYDPKAIDQSDGPRPGYVFECECKWRRVEPVIDIHVPVAPPDPAPDLPELTGNGWTASRSPCRRANDVAAR
jgi:hypothetical protein